jgi:hypothetical protein
MTSLCGYNHLVQETERERVVPLKFFEDRDDRLHTALAQHQADDCLIRVLSAKGLVERPKRIVLVKRIEKIQHWWNGVL